MSRARGATIAFGLSWDHDKRGRRALVALAVLTALAFAVAPLPTANAAEDATVAVVVREAPNAGNGPESLVDALGGRVTARLGIIDGFAATVPSSSVAALAGHPGVLAVTPDGTLTLTGKADAPGQAKQQSTTASSGEAGFTTLWSASGLLAFDPRHDSGSLYQVTNITGARPLWNQGITGQGIDVALIDSGIAPVAGIDGTGKVVNGPDLSFESQSDATRYLDTFGHGTHMAGVIAGRDPVSNYRKASFGDFLGMAPEARIISLKVADAHGNVDVSQVIAAIDWVVQHRNDPGLNIRVLNLSFGTDSLQSYQLDPLSFAAEAAWRAGIVVVVAAGNQGNQGGLTNPAINPFVIAVGADATSNTSFTGDDVIPTFSSCGTSSRPVDVVAPGQSIASLRVPGSWADLQYSGARVGQRYFRGSGTSQAAAVVSGAAALLLQAHPKLTPDQVKLTLQQTAVQIPGVSSLCQGAGLINVQNAVSSPSYLLTSLTALQLPATGGGTLEGARGSIHLYHNGIPLTGEQDIFGNPFDSVTHAALESTGSAWDGGVWNGASWSGASWSGASWSGASWSGASWSGASWSGASWSGASWSGASWSGASWSGASWSSEIWSGSSWSGIAF